MANVLALPSFALPLSAFIHKQPQCLHLLSYAPYYKYQTQFSGDEWVIDFFIHLYDCCDENCHLDYVRGEYAAWRDGCEVGMTRSRGQYLWCR